MFVMNTVPAITCFNPRVIEVSDETITMEEGCLSYPGLYVKIKRPKAIKARYFDVTGEGITREFDGITARCFLHELDHMDGIDFLQRANSVHRNQAMKKWKKNKKFIKMARQKEQPNYVESEIDVPETFTYSTPE
jgi:peptide deformylase